MGSILEEMHRMKMMNKMEELMATGGNKHVEDHKMDGVYVCKVCGYVYDEAKEGKPFTTTSHCPICHVGQQQFVRKE